MRHPGKIPKTYFGYMYSHINKTNNKIRNITLIMNNVFKKQIIFRKQQVDTKREMRKSNMIIKDYNKNYIDRRHSTL